MANISTIGLDNLHRTIQLSDGSLINCQIYDTAGQERFRALNTTYYRRADAVLLVYDITNKKSFNNIRDFYIPAIKEYCKKDVIVILLGNKADLKKERKVKCEEGINLAIKEKYEFKESSCIQNQNVSGAFESLIERWNFLQKREEEEMKPPKERKRSNTVCGKNKTIEIKNDEIKTQKKRLNTIQKNEYVKPQKIILSNKQNPPPNHRKCC